jgi:hypothetical protein
LLLPWVFCRYPSHRAYLCAFVGAIGRFRAKRAPVGGLKRGQAPSRGLALRSSFERLGVARLPLAGRVDSWSDRLWGPRRDGSHRLERKRNTLARTRPVRPMRDAKRYLPLAALHARSTTQPLLTQQTQSVVKALVVGNVGEAARYSSARGRHGAFDRTLLASLRASGEQGLTTVAQRRQCGGGALMLRQNGR